ncbi:MAG: SusC/RagA family TonB-linked outer membrane protein, partial [Flavobacteriaceae bacterium]|nr:SusC/RagA family TonB-linked outer membrane protein [Flavobacteriaceae bacterium]
MKKRILQLILLLCFSMLSGNVLAQINVTGVVSDELGELLPGVNILVKGTTTGAITDFDGKYSISAPDASSVLVFSYIGFENQEIVVGNQTTINLTLKASAESLGEIVVIGYGTQRKATLTGSVADVKGEVLEAAPTNNITNTLSGRLTGVTALNRTGEPGDDVSSITIRGLSTLGNNDALVVIDGVAGRIDINQIDPRDIESISILKDASAAIYGARAANGVILITTKRGKIGKPSINVTFNQGIYQPTFVTERANSQQIATFQNLRAADLGNPLPWTADELTKLGDGSDPTRYPNTNWTDEIFKNNSTQSKAGLSVSGGSDAVKYFLSSNFSEVGSIFKDGINESKRIGILSNIDVAVNDNLSVSVDMSYSNQDVTYPSDDADPGNLLLQTYGNFPYLLADNPDGSINDANPGLIATKEAGYRKEDRDNLSTKVGFKYKIAKVDGLSVDGFIAYNKTNITSKHWT